VKLSLVVWKVEVRKKIAARSRVTVSFSGSPRLQLRLRWRKDLTVAWEKRTEKDESGRRRDAVRHSVD